MNIVIRITMHTDENMTHKRLNITLHPEDIDKLDRICKNRDYMKKGQPKRSTMIARLIQEYDENKDKVK